MIAPSFSITATERVLPAMALNFTTAVLDSRVTFTRTGNTATVTNSSGYVVPINADLPRFDFNPTTLTCKGLLIEESRVNLLLRSEDFSTTWYNTDSSEQLNAIVSPGNTLTADKLVEGTLNVFHAIQQDIASVSLSSYTFSVFAKYGQRNIQLWFGFANVAGNPVANFDLQNGVLGTTSGSITSTIENYGNGWYKCSATVTSAVTVAFSCFIGLTTSPSAGRAQSYTGDGTSGAYIWGAQLEQGSFGTSYIPTVASQVTRTADTATMTGINFSSWYNASEGAVCCEFQLSNIAANNRIAFDLNDNGTNNRFAYRSITASGFDQLVVRSGGVTYATITSATSASASITKISSCYKINNFGLSKNAADALLDTAGDVPVGNSQIIIGSGFGGAEFLNGYLRKLNYYKQRLINAELAAFSK